LRFDEEQLQKYVLLEDKTAFIIDWHEKLVSQRPVKTGEPGFDIIFERLRNELLRRKRAGTITDKELDEWQQAVHLAGEKCY
jgi:hypothetical protein